MHRAEEQINACRQDGMSDKSGSKSPDCLDFPAQPLYFSGLVLLLWSSVVLRLFSEEAGSWMEIKSPLPPQP